MPVLILPIAEDLDELFENSSVTAMTPLCELSRIMEMTIDFAFMLVI